MLGIFLLSCSGVNPGVPIEPTFVVVEVAGELGSADSPLPFSSQPESRTVTVTTMNRDAEPYPFSGELVIDVRPGRFESDQRIELIDGSWSGEVEFSAAFGPTRVWATHQGAGRNDPGATWATGVGEEIYYSFPTISQMNNHENHDTNHLEGEFAEIRTADRRVVVTRVGTAGFWMTDLDSLEEKGAPKGNYASLFVYTFRKPEVSPGQRLSVVNGNDQEYLGTTQLSFPTYSATDEDPLQLPIPPVVTESELCDDDAMEALESSIISVDSVLVPSMTPGDYEDYLEYGQWPASVGNCDFYIDSSGTTFDPVPNAGAQLSTVTGLVSQVFSKWIIIVTESEDILGGATGQTRQLSRPRARHPDGRPSTYSRLEPHNH